MQKRDTIIQLGSHLRAYDTEVSIHLDTSQQRDFIILAEGGFGGGAIHISLSDLVTRQERVEQAYLCGTP